MNRTINILVSGVVVAALSGCAEPGDSTKMGAITGGAVGAGLGALVGSASGDPGTGLLLGAAAGAGTGAFVGNALDAQNSAMRAQDEALERQERLLAAQQREVDELRKLGEDSPPGSSVRGSLGRTVPQATDAQIRSRREEIARANRQTTLARTEVPQLSDRTIAVQRVAPPAQPSRVTERAIDVAVASPKTSDAFKTDDAFDSYSEEINKAATLNQPSSLSTPECAQAAGEIEKMATSTETADKLLHVRRALRLCPDSPDHHVELGNVYLTLNRRADAEFEFHEALQLDPQHAVALQALRELSPGK